MNAEQAVPRDILHNKKMERGDEKSTDLRANHLLLLTFLPKIRHIEQLTLCYVSMELMLLQKDFSTKLHTDKIWTYLHIVNNCSVK
jgi:hypothetical protein